MKKLLCALIGIMLCGALPILSMELDMSDTVDAAIYAFDVPKLKLFIEEKGFDPNLTPQTQGFECWNAPDSRSFLLEIAVIACWMSRHIRETNQSLAQKIKAQVEYLIPLTTNNRALKKALTRALAWIDQDDPYLSEIEQQLLEEAKKRGLNLEKAYTRALFLGAASLTFSIPVAKKLLDAGADRAERLGGKAVLESFPVCRESLYREDESPKIAIMDFLRKYGPDLKTQVALQILNQAQEEKISSEVLHEKLGNDGGVLSFISRLARYDKDVEKKWIALGMPYLEKAAVRNVKPVEKTVQILDGQPKKRAQEVQL